MKIILAPDSFKGSISAREAVAAMETGIRRVSPKIKVTGMPLSDGGEGLVEALVEAAGGNIRRKKVIGPLGDPIMATYGLIDGGKTGVIETAAAAGLALLAPAGRDPLLATTFGVGELVASAIENGCTMKDSMRFSALPTARSRNQRQSRMPGVFWRGRLKTSYVCFFGRDFILKSLSEKLTLCFAVNSAVEK